MSFQNRVAPTGELHAVSARGTLMGNRGIIHDDDGNIVRSHAHQHWVTCSLSYRRRKQTLMAPGHYTQLFFLDEVTALAAGHRPCATCRRERYKSFVDVWTQVHGAPTCGRSVPQSIDKTLHAARMSRNKGKVTFQAKLKELPNGTIFMSDDKPILLSEASFLEWNFSGYRETETKPIEDVTVLTPKPLVDIYSAGWRPEVQF